MKADGLKALVARAEARMNGLVAHGGGRLVGELRWVAQAVEAVEYVAGTPYRDARFGDRDRWFARLLEILRTIHGRGVAHGDLKSKGNLLVTPDERPCVIDFGTAFILKPGFHPINNGLFRTGRQLDLNAWVKHKYHGFYRNASDEDRALLDYGWLEMLVRRFTGRSMDRLVRRDTDRR